MYYDKIIGGFLEVFNYIFLAISVSIDALGIGITYGIKNTKIYALSIAILFGISLLITSISVFIGNIISTILPSNFANYIGICILIVLGLWIMYQSTKKETTTNKSIKRNYNFFIKSLGITIKIIRDPITSDLDLSRGIDFKEAIYLGFALSLDSIGIGICSSIAGFNSFILPLFIASFQLLFLSFGILIGTKINSYIRLPKNVWSVISGILLIMIGISKLFI